MESLIDNPNRGEIRAEVPVGIAIAISVVTAFLSLGGIDIVSELYISYPAAWSDLFVGILPFSPKIFTFKAGLLVAE